MRPLDEIERAALDDAVPLATALRRCIALGGQAGSERLRDWASRELNGYGKEDDLPPYRVVPAPIQLDGSTMTALIKHQSVAPSQLPEGIREHIREEVRLTQGVGALEAYARSAAAEGGAVKVSLPMGADIAQLLSSEYNTVDRIYWAVSSASVLGALDQIRTALTRLTAEMRAEMPGSQSVPDARVADNAVSVVVSGKRNRVSIAPISQAAGTEATAAVSVSSESDQRSPWSRHRRIGAAVVGAATVLGTAAAIVAIFV